MLPAALWVLRDPNVRFDGPQLAALVMTGILHLFDAECHVRGYRAGDLSVVYPVARGTGPLLSVVGAVVVLGERVSFVATLGTLCIAAGTSCLRAPVSWPSIEGDGEKHSESPF